MVKRTELNIATPSNTTNHAQYVPNQAPKSSEAQQISEVQQENIKLEPNLDRLGRYKAFLEAVNPKRDVVYVPCFGVEIAHIDAFSNSRRIINVELMNDVIQAIKKLGKSNVEGYCEDAKTFNPGEPVDVLILWNQAINPNLPAQFVSKGGYILCNDYHSAASNLKDNADFELLGIVRPDYEKKCFVFDTDSPQNYWKEVETEDELRKAPPSWGACNYDYALQVVEQVTGKTDNVLKRYKELYEAHKPDKLYEEITVSHRQVGRFSPSLNDYLQEVRDENPELSNLSDEQILDMPAATQKVKIADEDERLIIRGEQVIFLMKLPRKKGDVDDLFVFRKVN